MSLPAFLLIVVGVLLNTSAQLLLKAGVMPLGVLPLAWASLWPNAVRVAGQWQIFAGLACYVVSVGIWIIALSRVEVSLAYPMLSLGYLVNALAAWWWLGEALGPIRIFGMLLILAGVFVMSRT